MRVLLTTILLTFTVLILKAQTSVSFYHLGNSTFQNNYLNPAIIPEGDLFIGIPVLSGIHFHVNNKLSYNETFTNEGNETIIDKDKVVPNLNKNNLVSGHVNVNLFHVGFKTKTGSLISLSARERIEADFLYSEELIDFFWNGGERYVNEEIKLSRLGAQASHFREIGLGYATPLNDRLTVGARAKFLIGFADISTPGNFSGTMRSSGEAFQFSAEWENASYRTSGLDIYNGNEGNLGSHLLMNGNRGVALDIGGTYHLNRYYTVTASLLDVGFISWNEDIENEALTDTTFTYTGSSLDSIGNVREDIFDFIDIFDTDTNRDTYRSLLPIKAYANWVYHYSQKTDFHVTVGSRYLQRRFKMLYGAGVTHKFGRIFTASLTATKLPQQFFNAGAAFAVKGGPVQMYMAVDQLVNFSVPDAKAIDFRFGMNLVFNRKQGGTEDLFSNKGTRRSPKGLDTDSFLGSKVKTKKRDGIYSIIKKQKKRELKDKKSKRKKVVRKSPSGRSSSKNN